MASTKKNPKKTLDQLIKEKEKEAAVKKQTPATSKTIADTEAKPVEQPKATETTVSDTTAEKNSGLTADTSNLKESAPKDTFTPLDAPSVEKPYAVPPQLQPDTTKPIPEPTIKPPVFDDKAPTDLPNQPPKPPPITNPDLVDATAAEKQRGAEQLTDTLLDGYDKAHELGRNFIKVPPEKIMELIEEDKIDLETTFALSEDGSPVNIVQFVESFNKQTDEIISVSPAFKERVRPAMIRVLIKRGWGVSDEQFLIIEFGKDALMKLGAIIQLKAMVNSVWKHCFKVHEKNKTLKSENESYADTIEQQKELIKKLQEQMTAKQTAETPTADTDDDIDFSDKGSDKKGSKKEAGKAKAKKTIHIDAGNFLEPEEQE